tara:strand:+ start:1302 stop:2003 length:702 start_codon:yes stop_codon:yes gene_type:complete
MNWQSDALKHSKEENPKEAVGLIINVKGKEKYIPCRNIAFSQHDCFTLDPDDYLKAEGLGEIVAVFHSHPNMPPTPSQADKISCEEHGLPWYIVNPVSEEWSYFEPCGYKPPLLGRPWVWGITDCWALIRDWYKEKRNIDLKDYERPLHFHEFLNNPVFEKYATETGFRELEENEKLENGDVILMAIRYHTLNHVALFFDGDVIHHLTDRLSCREPYSQWLLKCSRKRYRYVS